MASFVRSIIEPERKVLQRILLLAIHYEYTRAIQDSIQVLCHGNSDESDQTVLHEALDYTVLSSAERVIMREQGFREFQYSPLMLACDRNKVDIVELLLKKNASIHFRNMDKGGLNALHVACLRGNLVVMRLLIEKAKTQPSVTIRGNFQKLCLNVVVNSRTTKNGLTPLMFAVKIKDESEIVVKIVKCLLETGVIDLKQTNKKKQNVFHIAAHGQKLACLGELHSKLPESEPNPLLAVDKRGWGVLHHACAGGTGERNCDVLQWLFDHIPELKSPELLNQNTETTGSTPLLVACEYQKVAVVKMLVEIPDIDVSALTDDMKNGLHIAAIHDSPDIAELLMEKECSLIQQDSEGDTPLHIAQRKASFNVLDLLGDAKEVEKAEHLRNKAGLTPRDIEPEDVIPAEIRKGGEKDIEIYKNALKKGKRLILLCNLLLLGQARVGKTSLYRLLVGKSFLPDLDPTLGIDNQIIEGAEVVDHRYISALEFHELKEKELMQENDNLFEDSLVEEFIESKGPPVSRKAQAVTEDVLMSQIQTIKAGIQRRVDEKRKEAEREMRQNVDSPIASSRFSQLKKMGASVTTGESAVSKPIAGTLRKPEPESSKPQLPPPLKPTGVPVSRHPKVNTPVQKDDQGERSEQPAEEVIPKQEETDGDRPNATSGPLIGRKQSTTISRKIKKCSKKKAKEPKLRLNALDFAGQPVYRPMHHCFITRRAIYLVVFNLQEVANYLDNEGKNRSQIDDPIEEIRYWLNSISAHIYPLVRQQLGDEKMKRLLLVGTHQNPKDPKDGTCISEEMLERINKKLTDLFYTERSRCVSHLHFMPNQKIFAAIENSFDDKSEREASGAKALQDQLTGIANKLPFLKELSPIVWLSFEKNLMWLRASLKRRKQSVVVKLETVEKLARRCKIEQQDEIDLALKFFHDVGKICCLKRLPKLFLSDAEQVQLASLVLLNPEWLITVMKNVMELPKTHSDVEGSLISKFEKTGTASVELLKTCWADCLNDNISFEQLCLMLKAYGLIYPVEVVSISRSASALSTGEGKHSPPDAADSESEPSRSQSEDFGVVSSESPTTYLVPCKLPLAVKREVNAQPDGANILFYFDFLGFLPDEVFQRLICLMFARSQAKPKSVRAIKLNMPPFTRSRCQFYFDDCLWEIEQEIPHLKVSVLPFCKKSNPSDYLKAIHKEFLYKICNDSGLKGLMYFGGPMVTCKCDWSGVLHVLEYRAGEPPSEGTPTEGFCDGCGASINVDQRQDSKIKATSTSSSVGGVQSMPADDTIKLDVSMLFDLCEALKDVIDWEGLGLALHLHPVRTLERIKKEKWPDVKACRREVVLNWLKGVDTCDPPTIGSLVRALTSSEVNQPNIAKEVQTNEKFRSNC